MHSCTILYGRSISLHCIHSYLKLTSHEIFSHNAAVLKKKQGKVYFLHKKDEYFSGSWVEEQIIVKLFQPREAPGEESLAVQFTLLCDALFNLNYYRVDKKLNTFLCSATSNKPTNLPISCSTVCHR